jgi:endoglycosylceramidase
VPSVADKLNLARLYKRVAKEIRKVDPDHLILFESVTWDDFIRVGFNKVPGGKAYQNRSALSYHAYDNVNFNADLQLKSRAKDT